MSDVQIGQVVLIAEGGGLVPLIVKGVSHGRIEAVNPEGTERSLSFQRLFWISGTILAADEEVHAYWNTVQTLGENLRIEDAWSHLEAEQFTRELRADELLRILNIEDSHQTRDAVAVAVFRGRTHFKLRNRMIVASDKETVAEALERAERERVEHEAFEEARSWLTVRLKGYDVPAITPSVQEHLDAIESVALFGRAASTSRLGLELLRALPDVVNEEPERAAFELLCALGTYTPYENLAPRRAHIKKAFPETVEVEVQHLNEAVYSSNRTDMTGLLTVSIDDHHTDEIDDAFAVEGNRLHVFIADVAECVPKDSACDVEAFKRLATIYIPEGKIPMLPARIGQDLASLNQGKVRPALCFSGSMANDGTFSDVVIREVLCSVDRRLDYPSVDEWLATGDGPSELMPMLRALETWSEGHLNRRKQSGALVFQRKELYPHADAFGRVSLHQPDANGPSRLLIAEMMVAVCCAAARFMRDERIPAIYRVQAPPDEEIDTSQLENRDPAVEYALLRLVKPSGLSIHSKPHAAIGADCYTQVSSPIRRYADLLLHRQIKARLRGSSTAYTVEQMEEIMRDIEQRQGIIRRVERESNRYWLLRYLEQAPPKDLDAVVLRRLKKRYLVNLPSLCMPATLLSRGRLATGQVVRVRITEVDARSDRLVIAEV